MDNLDTTTLPPAPQALLSPPLPSVAEEEPETKRLKMSTTTSDGEECTTTTGIKKQRYKRRKVAIFFAYCGVGYQGMQKNPGAKTIEGDLEEALFLSGAVPEQDRGNPKRYDWARSARTDKGVSAVGQRVTASFNAKKFCDRRRYVYLIPVFALDPCCHRDRESVMASLGSESELVKCLECSERGRKVVGLVGKHKFESKGASAESGFVQNTGDVVVHSTVKEDLGVSFDKGDGSHSNYESRNEGKISIDNGNSELHDESVAFSRNEGTDLNSGSMNCSSIVVGEEKSLKGSDFCYGEKEKEQFNHILKYFVGTHNFHNFTTRTKAEDPAARRFIISLTANTTVTVEGLEFVKCEIVGQSFMLHQIRKMIGLAVAIMRNCAPESLVERALQKDVNINVPTAPEVGLYLEECFFASYNQKWKDTHEEVSMKSYEKEADDFKIRHIYPHIANTEHKDGAVALWLHSLNHRNYPDLRLVNNEDTDNRTGAEVASVPE
ncbi:tRNA pseudouridine synthase family protein [Quillaja saponaria]|uniref:tRNA pseudouridine synthase family protein n=1 Tax=Quillaja saponaria TaxID=32244 RepID=A0AAD7QE69_QUISA|nr:tRNA pseudouridine synthase family protein [Quillaja saponaria]